MSKWLELARSQSLPSAKSAKSAKSPGEGGQETPFGPFGAFGTGGERETATSPNAHDPGRGVVPPPPRATAPDDLRKWPPTERYRVADLEQAGLSRPEAIAWVRGEGAGVELPVDRQRWPKDAQAAFWATVRDLNRGARETGRAVNGRAPFALEDAERAVRETWRAPRPLGGVA